MDWVLGFFGQDVPLWFVMILQILQSAAKIWRLCQRAKVLMWKMSAHCKRKFRNWLGAPAIVELRDEEAYNQLEKEEKDATTIYWWPKK